jgi:hypothetical protein
MRVIRLAIVALCVSVVAYGVKDVEYSFEPGSSTTLREVADRVCDWVLLGLQ